MVDIGHQHEPTLHNFDHHQFPKEQVPTCALSLVLRHLKLYEDASEFCDWLEVAEWFDCRGPKEPANGSAWTAKPWRSSTRQSMSPCSAALLLRTSINPGEPIWELMRMIGEDLVDYITSLRDSPRFHRRACRALGSEDGLKAIYMPRTEPLPEEPSAGLGRYIEQEGLEETVIAMIYPDRSGEGYGMRRFNDDLRLDFTQIDSEPDVHFTHKQGFIAKTSATQREVKLSKRFCQNRLKNIQLSGWKRPVLPKKKGPDMEPLKVILVWLEI